MPSEPDFSWVFGYGSLIWRPAFAYGRRERAELLGYERAFSQRSSDHRGTAELPGRVVTLRARPEASTVGVAYELQCDSEQTLAVLDLRERAGYERRVVEVRTEAGIRSAHTWIAPPGNAFDAGEEATLEIARIIQRAHGPSGSNREYLDELARALTSLDAEDAVVSAIVSLLRGFDESSLKRA